MSCIEDLVSKQELQIKLHTLLNKFFTRLNINPQSIFEIVIYALCKIVCTSTLKVNIDVILLAIVSLLFTLLRRLHQYQISLIVSFQPMSGR